MGSAIGRTDRFAPRAPATAAPAATSARTVFAMAPARAGPSCPRALGRIEIPVAIVAGTADAIVSVGRRARTYAGISRMPSWRSFPGDFGRDVFLVACTKARRAIPPGLCIDAPGVDRDRDTRAKTAGPRGGVLREKSGTVTGRSRRCRGTGENSRDTAFSLDLEIKIRRDVSGVFGAPLCAGGFHARLALRDS